MNSFTTKSRSALAVCAAIGASALLAPGASAYTGATTQCNGASIIGGGASLQKTAQTKWGANIATVPSVYPASTPFSTYDVAPYATVPTTGFGFAGAPGVGCVSFRSAGKHITYESIGSGAGRKQWNAAATYRDPSANWISTDEAPDPTEETNIEKISTTVTSPIETIPVAQAAIAIIANLPSGCALATTTARTATLSNLEKLEFGTTSTWGSLLGATALTPSSCANIAVKRIARLDSSGSSFAFKKVLNSNNSHWSTPTNYTTAANNTVWPAAVTRPTATGGGALADLVNATPGSLGYVDLATARGKSFGFTGVSDKTFWLRINTPAAGGITVTNDAAKDSAQAPATFGANCGATRTYSGVPTSTNASTQGAWFNATSATANGQYASGNYPICTLTYELAFDKYSTVTGQSEPKTRSVFDYTNWVVSTAGGQSVLNANDYQTLPTGTGSLQSLSAAGASRINW